MITGIDLFDSGVQIFYLWGLTKSEVYRRKLDTWDEPLARILNFAARMKKGEDQSDIRTQAAKCTEVSCGVCERLFNCNKFVITL